MKTTIVIQAIKPPGEGKKSAMITTTGGEKLWIWRDKLGLVKEGATYEVVIEENNGFKNIKTLKQVAGPPAATAREPFVSGLPDRPRPPAPQPSSNFRTPEQMFVSEVICAYIAAGKCANPAELKETITAIRRAYNGNWGGPNGNGTAFINPDPAPHMNGNGNGHAPH